MKCLYIMLIWTQPIRAAFRPNPVSDATPSKANKQVLGSGTTVPLIATLSRNRWWPPEPSPTPIVNSS